MNFLNFFLILLSVISFSTRFLTAAQISIIPKTRLAEKIGLNSPRVYQGKKRTILKVGSSFNIGNGDIADFTIENELIMPNHLQLISWQGDIQHPIHWAVRNNTSREYSWVNGNTLKPGQVLALDPCARKIRFSFICDTGEIELFVNLSYPESPLNNTFCTNFNPAKRVKGDYPILKGYKIVSLLGEGGFGKAYLAEDENNPSKTFVVKQLILEKAKSNKKRIELFTREAKLLDKYNKIPGIPKLAKTLSKNIGGVRNLFIIMEHIKGEDLESKLYRYSSQGKLIPTHLVLTWMVKVLRILEAMHDKGHFHRDIKPANMMLRARNGELYLIDLGAASKDLLEEEDAMATMIGSHFFSHPLQLAGKPNIRTELYSVAATTFYLLTNQMPKIYNDWIKNENKLKKSRLTNYSENGFPSTKLMTEFYDHLSKVLERAFLFQQNQPFESAGEMRAEFEKLLSSHFELHAP